MGVQWVVYQLFIDFREGCDRIRREVFYSFPVESDKAIML
jgi:hypothetical protein